MNKEYTNRKPNLIASRKGLTLIEMALVFVLIGILVSFGSQLIPMMIKQGKFKDNRIIVQQTKTAIFGYALATGRLPCAATNPNTGLAVANTYRGYLPWATLGINSSDTYRKPLFYAVDSTLTTTASVPLLKTALNNLIANPATQTLFCMSSGPNLPMAFVVISSGENLRGDPPNDDNNDRVITTADNNFFANPAALISSNYDDIMESMSLSLLNGSLP